MKLCWHLLISTFVTLSLYAQSLTGNEGRVSLISRIADKPLLASTILIFLFATINYLIDLFKKDKILRQLLDKYVVFQMKGNIRHRGTMRIESTGIEIVSEESRQRGHAPSYLFSGPEVKQITAYIRYLDSMNETERRERDADLDRVFHPQFMTRLLRRIRNFGVALRESVNKTVQMIWGSIKKSKAFQPLKRTIGEVDVGREIDTLQQDTYEYAMKESYERLIERFVGTKVTVRFDDKNKNKGEIPNRFSSFVGVLKEYNERHIYLMNVQKEGAQGYTDEWEQKLTDINKRNPNVRDERGIRCRIEGRHLIIENNAPYDVQLWGLRYEGDGGNEQKFDWNLVIPAFTVERIFMNPGAKQENIAPFTKLFTHKPRTHKNFEHLVLPFRSFREADVVFPREYCRIVESAEKYEPVPLDIEALVENPLDPKRSKDVEFKDTNGNVVKGINVIHGYVTNVNEDRIDLQEINRNYGRRWSVQNAFEKIDDKLRTPRLETYLPNGRRRIVSQIALVNTIGRNNTQRQPIADLLFKPVAHQPTTYHKMDLPIKVLALTGNGTDAEFPRLNQFDYVRNHHLLYHQIREMSAAPIHKAHLLWIGHGEIYKDGYHLNIDAEHRIKDFVSHGGIVIVSGQILSNLRRRSIGWIPELLIGEEREETVQFTPTREGKQLFRSPYQIKQMKMHDTWSEWSNKYRVFATANGNQDAAILTLRFQAGMYIITSLKNQTPEDVAINSDIMHNLIHFAVKWYDQQNHSGLYYS